MASGRIRNSKQWTQVKKRKDGAGLAVYLSGPDLREAFGFLPAAIEFKVRAMKGRRAVVIDMKAGAVHGSDTQSEGGHVEGNGAGPE